MHPIRPVLAPLTFPFLTLGLLALFSLAPGTAAAAPRPADAQAQLSFGMDMAKRGLWREALFRFQEAERLDPDHPGILNNMAVAYEATGEFEKALDYYQRALKVSPSRRDLRNNYARFVEFYQSFRGEKKKGPAKPAAPPPSDLPQLAPPTPIGADNPPRTLPPDRPPVLSTDPGQIRPPLR